MLDPRGQLRLEAEPLPLRRVGFFDPLSLKGPNPMCNPPDLPATISRAASRPAPPRRLQRTRSRPRYRPALEPVERRLVPATFVVTTTDNTGHGSLYQAILAA